MKLTHFKVAPFILAGSALLALSGCGGGGTTTTTGISSDNGIVVIDVVDDSNNSADGVVGGTVIANITTNDTLDGAAFTLGTDVNITAVTETTPLVVDPTTGSVTVPAGTPDGTYVETYTICENLNPTNCDDANITVTVAPRTEAQCLIAAGGYQAIEIGGKSWLDRNLGAGEVAASVTDSAAYGNYYQWGRGAEGHEDNNTKTLELIQGTHADTILPDLGNDWDGKFIISATNFDWTTGAVDTDGSERSGLWSTPQSDINLNQVCPCGYVVPTSADFNELNATTLAELKLPYIGGRTSAGVVEGADSFGYYWTADSVPTSTTNAVAVLISGSVRELRERLRIQGYGIRCIKPQ